MEIKNAIKDIRPLGFQWVASDPFLFCVHHEDFFPEGNKDLGPDPELLKGRQLGRDFTIKDGWRMYHGDTVPGFPNHPHRGFETVTVVRKGMVDHSDSLGGAGRYGNGDVQWMTAGKGIQHAEMFPLIYPDKKNPMELFQIWLNLPSSAKFVEPHYKMLWSETIPKYTSVDVNGKKTLVEVIAGELFEEKAPAPPPNSWAANEINEVAIFNLQMQPGAKWSLPKASKGINRTIYFYLGNELIIDGKTIPKYHSAVLDPEQSLELNAGSGECHILVLQGKPIGEPIVQHGPFVMNNRDEIQRAFWDYQQTQFGGWPWGESDPVHERSKGRFALHGDGTLEEKS